MRSTTKTRPTIKNVLGRGSLVKQYFLEEQYPIEDQKKMEGSFYDEKDFPLIIREDADVYRLPRSDQGVPAEPKLLFIFRKSIIPKKQFTDAIKAFKEAAKKTVNSRGKAGGHVVKDQVSPNVAGFVSPDKFKSRIIYKDGSVSDYYVSNKVKSLIAGYYDKPKLSEKSEVLKKDKIPCRTTAFTENFPEKWEIALPLIKTADQLYAKFAPNVHAEQYALVSQTPKYQIDNTAFSTITVNYNWRTACHVDEGDYHNGLTVVLVAEEGRYKGGYLGYPQYGVAIDVREGDFLLQDPHQFHCNTPILPITKDYTRLSMILYYRENIQNCITDSDRNGDNRNEVSLIGGGKTQAHIPVNWKLSLPRNEVARGTRLPPLRSQTQIAQKARKGRRINQVGGVELSVVEFDLSSKGRKRPPSQSPFLKLYVRPGTTDEKVIDEVLKRNVYEKPSQGFLLEAGELWFDLGGNIGTFALLALSKGCSVIIYEPEPENLMILEKNLEANFANQQCSSQERGCSRNKASQSKKDNCWEIVPAAITVTSSSSTRAQKANLYLSKGTNKYRHTLYPKRGRESIEVAVISFHEEMDKWKPDGVKIDIEGAEIDILESVQAEDWQAWQTKKLVFEYSFDIDNSIPRFLNIVDRLREYFSVVYYTKVKEDELVYNHFPAATIVYCLY